MSAACVECGNDDPAEGHDMCTDCLEVTSARRVEDADEFKRLRRDPAVTGPLVWHCSYRGTDRVARYRGDCIVCHRRCWEFDDGENDPRGVLGDDAMHVVYTEDGSDRELRACATCGNDYGAYHEALIRAAMAEDIDSLAPLP